MTQNWKKTKKFEHSWWMVEMEGINTETKGKKQFFDDFTDDMNE
jgi:hypothetical protein